MAWCRQATSHYLSRCWHRFMSPYGITMPQCANTALMASWGKEPRHQQVWHLPRLSKGSMPCTEKGSNTIYDINPIVHYICIKILYFLIDIKHINGELILFLPCRQVTDSDQEGRSQWTDVSSHDRFSRVCQCLRRCCTVHVHVLPRRRKASREEGGRRRGTDSSPGVTQGCHLTSGPVLEKMIWPNRDINPLITKIYVSLYDNKTKSCIPLYLTEYTVPMA